MVNTIDFFVSHRLPIARAAAHSGIKVAIASTGNLPNPNKVHFDFDFDFFELNISRAGKNPFAELKTLIELYKIVETFRPNIIHLITIKPIIYGFIIGRLFKVPGIVVAFAGLGTVFTPESVGERIRKIIISGVYKLCLKDADKKLNTTFIFQNKNDRKTINSLGLAKTKNAYLIPGSGIDLQEYRRQPEPDGICTVTLASRLLKKKGITEFVEAAKILETQGLNVRFQIAGAIDTSNPDSLTSEKISELENKTKVIFLGHRSDIKKLYAASHIVCLPSYYGEGLPKSLIEAAACGRPIVTTNLPGCRDAVDEGRTGLLVPPRDSDALAHAIRLLIIDKDKRLQFGNAARVLAEKKFNIDTVINMHLSIYQKLLEM